METLLPSEPDLKTWVEQFVASLQAERDRAAEFLDAQQARLERAEAAIEEQLRHPVDKTSPPAGPWTDQGRLPDGHLDWEAEKRRIIAALEADGDENDADRRAERLRIREVVQRTQKIVAEKDSQIRTLQQQLEEASRNLSTKDAEATVIREALDSDAAVQEERQRLTELEQQWREKLRQAEIDLSVERATLGRQRAALEARMRLITADSQAAGDKAGDDAKPVRGRWLARLGLTEADRLRHRQR